MKRMAVIGGIVIALIAVIKIGSIFIAPSEKNPTEGQTSTEETFQTVAVTPGTTVAREPVTIEIENGGGNESDPLETLPEDASGEQLTPETSQASANTNTNTNMNTNTNTTTKAAAAATTRAAVNYTVKDMESKTMYATKSVRIRESASTDSAVVGGLTPGQDVKATGETSNGWIRISYDGGSAYVSKSYLSTNKSDVVKETTAAGKSTSATKSSSQNTAKATTAAKETSAAAPAPTTASAEETIAPFPG